MTAFTPSTLSAVYVGSIFKGFLPYSASKNNKQR